jgi:L-lactate dehydrogenase
MKISVIGAGMVGSTCAYRLAVENIASEIVINDVFLEKAEGESLDIGQGSAMEGFTRISYGDVNATAGSDIIVYCAGRPRSPDMKSRSELISVNVDIVKQTIPAITNLSPNAIIIVVANPSDVLAFATLKVSGFDKSKVISSGTVVDSARFGYFLGEFLGIPSHQIQAYSLGEHGNTQVQCFSTTKVQGIDLETYCKINNKELTTEVKESIIKKTTFAGADIIAKKRFTHYGIASAVCKIARAIALDQKIILPVGSLIDGQYGVESTVLSVPTIVGKNGVEQTLEINLSADELESLQASAVSLKGFQDELAL